MIIQLSPQASDKTTQISVNNDLITIDGTEYDLSSIPDGGQAEGELPAIGTIKRIDGEIHITILYQYASKTATQAQKFPVPIDITNGEVIL